LTSSLVASALISEVELLSSRFVTTRCLYWRRAVACPEPIADEAATPNSKPWTSIEFSCPLAETSPFNSPARLVRTLR
jgi:hypothetical protein